MNSKADKKLVIVSYQQKDISVILHDNRLYSLKVYAENDVSLLGNIYIGKVQNIARNIQAAFVEIKSFASCLFPIQSMLMSETVKRMVVSVAGMKFWYRWRRMP